MNNTQKFMFLFFVTLILIFFNSNGNKHHHQNPSKLNEIHKRDQEIEKSKHELRNALDEKENEETNEKDNEDGNDNEADEKDRKNIVEEDYNSTSSASSEENEENSDNQNDIETNDKDENSTFTNNIDLILNPEYKLCDIESKIKLTFVSFVVTEPEKFDRRQQIRETWANSEISDKFKLFFMVGSSSDEIVNTKINEEFNKFSDIVQGDFNEPYQNITKITMAAFKWISIYCSNSFFTVQIDDHVLVNTYKLLEYLESLVDNQQHQNKLIGYVNSGIVPQRNSSNPHYIPIEVFSESYYDDFCNGTAYILSSELAKTFYEYSLNFSIPLFSDYIKGIIF